MGNEIYRIDIPIEVKDTSGPPLKAAQSNVDAVDRVVEKTTRAVKRLSAEKIKLDADDRASGKMDRVRQRADRAARTKPITFGLVAVDQATAKMDQVEERARRMARAKPITFPLSMVGAGTESLESVERGADRARHAVERVGQTHVRASIGADDRATRVVRGVLDAGSRLAGKTWTVTMKAVDLVTAPVRGIFRLLTSVPGMLGLGAGGLGGIVAPLMAADEMTRANQGFTTFLGSAEKAKSFMADLQKFGADTPFETDWLTGQATTLLPALDKDVGKVMRTMKAFGDAASLTGAGTNGMELALLGFRQIGAIGTLNMEELRQVTENLRVPMTVITDELGMTQAELKGIGSKGIPAATAMDAILRALERPTAKGGFLGGMSAMMDTLSGQFSMLKDNLKINLFQRWGKGLEFGAIPLLKEFNGMFTAGADTVKDWGDGLERAGRGVSTWLTEKVKAASQAVKALTSSTAWQNADGFWAKAKVAWDQLIQEPFDTWWAGGGEKWITDKAAAVGEGFGSALGGFLASALGIAAGDANDNSFVKAGKAAGGAFLDAFLEAFDASRIAQKAAEAGWGLVKETGKVTPGGDSPTAGTVAGIGILAWLAKKGFDVYGWVKNLRGATGGGAGSGQVVQQTTQAVRAGVQTAVAAETPVAQAITQGSRQLTIFDKGTMQPAFDLSSAPKIATNVAEAGTGYGTAAPLTPVAGAAAVLGGATFGWMVSQDIGNALTSYLDKEEAKRQAKLDATIHNLTPSTDLANTPAAFMQAKPKLSFWEDLFLSPWAKNQRDLKWEREQAAAKEAALANWKPPVNTMTDAQEQDALRQAFRLAREAVPVQAPTPPATEIRVTLDSKPTFDVKTTLSSAEFLALVRAHFGQLTDELQHEVARALEGARSNSQAVRGRLAIPEG